MARKLYAQDGFAVELEQTAYALNTTTIDLCLNVFPWAHFRKAKAEVKLHTLLYLRGNIPSFIHISDGKMHKVNVLDLMIPEAGKDYPQHLRRIKFHDTEHDKEPVFLTNNFDLPALTVAQLYRYRRQVELFFNELTASSYQGVLRHHRECGENANLDRDYCLRLGRHHKETPQD